MSYLVYDTDNDLSPGALTRSKNGIVLKSCYPREVKKLCKKWKSVEVKEYKKDESFDPHFVKITIQDHEALREHPNGAVLLKDKKEIITKNNVPLCIDISIFHGYKDIYMGDLAFTLTEYQKKLLNNIYTAC